MNYAKIPYKSTIHPRRINAKEVLRSQKGDEFTFPVADGFSKIVRKRLRIPRTHSEAGTTCKEWRTQGRTSRRTGEVSTWRIKRSRWSPCRLLVDSVHTLTCRTHIFLRTARRLRTLRTFFCVLHTRTAQVHDKGVCCTCVFDLSISPSSLLMIHPSLLFLDGHLETNPDYDFTDDLIHTILPYFPVLKAQNMRHSAPASRSLATRPDQTQTQVMSPTSSTRSLLWTMTRCSSTIRTTISPTSRKPRRRTLDISMFTQCLNPLFRTFLMHAIGKPLLDREKQKKGNLFVISVAKLMSKKSLRNSIRSYSLQTHTDDHLHQESYARSCREIKNWKYAAIRKEITENNEDWNHFYAAWSGITNSESFCSTILTYWSVMTYLRSSSSSYCLEFEKAWPRSWNAAKYTREYDFCWKRFWSSTCSTRSWRITQLFKKFGNTTGNRCRCRGFSEKKVLRIVGAKNHCNQYLYLAFQKERVENVYTTNRSYVYDLPCLGYLDLYSSGMTIPVISTRRSISISLTE